MIFRSRKLNEFSPLIDKNSLFFHEYSFILLFCLQRRLAQKYRIKVGAPALVLVKSGGTEISRPPRDLLDDPAGFPWMPRPLEQVC